MKKKCVVAMLLLASISAGCGSSNAANVVEMAQASDVVDAPGSSIRGSTVTFDSDYSSFEADEDTKTNSDEGSVTDDVENNDPGYKGALNINVYGEEEDIDSTDTKKPSETTSKIDAPTAQYDETSSDDLSQYVGTVEFVNYCNQTIDNGIKPLILTNLSVNEGYSLKFSLVVDDRTIYTVSGVAAGESKMVYSSDLGLEEGTYTVTLTTQAFSADGSVALNAVTQDFDLTISSAGEGEEAAWLENQEDGTNYETTVIYRADGMRCSAIVPSVIEIAGGQKGTDVFVQFRTTSVKSGTTVGIKATDKNGNASIKLASEDGGTIQGVLSGDKENTLIYTFDSDGSLLQSVGPIHCDTNGEKAKQGYYGTMIFNLNFNFKKEE